MDTFFLVAMEIKRKGQLAWIGSYTDRQITLGDHWVTTVCPFLRRLCGSPKKKIVKNKGHLTLPVPIPSEERKLTKFLFSHFFVVPQKVL